MENTITYFFGIEGISDKMCNNIVFDTSDNTLYLHKVKRGSLENYGEVSTFEGKKLDAVEEDIHLQLECILLNTFDNTAVDYKYKDNKTHHYNKIALYIKSCDSKTINNFKMPVSFEKLMKDYDDMYDGVETDNCIHDISKRLAYAIVGDYLILNKNVKS